MKYSNILITGGLGFVGGRLARFLGSQYKIYVSSRKTVLPEVLQQHGNAECILHDDLLTEDTFPAGIDIVIHMAALNESDCVSRPSEAILVNIDQTRLILENAIKKKVKKFIYFSTVHVYGAPLAGDIDESMVPRPSHPYAITHRAAEDYVTAAHDKGHIEALVIRLSNSFGAPVIPDVNRWTLLVNDLCRQAVTTKQLRLHSNGCQFRDFITLADVERAVMYLLEIPVKRENIINLAAGKSFTVMQMAQRIAACYAEITGTDIRVLLPEHATPTEEPALQLCPDRLNDQGYFVKNDFDAEIKDLILFCKKFFSPRD